MKPLTLLLLTLTAPVLRLLHKTQTLPLIIHMTHALDPKRRGFLKGKNIMAFKKFQKNIRQKRLGQWLRVNFKFARRKVRRFFAGDIRKAATSPYAKHLYIALAGGILAVMCIVCAHLCVLHLQDTEGMILQKLTYGKDYDTTVPYFRTLDAIGSSNHLCVTLQTARRDNLSDPTVALEQGGVNLKLAFTDGSTKEISLRKKFRFDSFDAGKQTHFIVTLPYGYTPFDIATFALTITAGADGIYDDWLCESAEVSFMLGGKRVLLASHEWQKPTRFGNGTGMLRTAELTDRRTKNATYNQMSLLFERLNDLAQEGMSNFADDTIKQNTLSSLALSNARALYMDVETISSERNLALLSQLGEDSRLPENETLSYNGTIYIDVSFNGKLPDGTYTKRYELDTPGKDDFEMSGASTFRMDMPEGMCVFDIAQVSISTADKSDAWAPRFVRLYLTLDFEKEMEIARFTDAYLEQQYDTSIFYAGYLDEPLAFDLGESNAIPVNEYQDIQKNYSQKLSDAAYKMYFENQSFYSRQINFYIQMLGLI